MSAANASMVATSHPVIAAAVALEDRHALAPEHLDFARLPAGLELELDGAVERLDGFALFWIEALQIGRHRHGARPRGNAAARGGGRVQGCVFQRVGQVLDVLILCGLRWHRHRHFARAASL